eukprot:4977361-Amphidinium_carterae.1
MSDREIIRTAVARADVLKYAADSLMSDREIILTAVAFDCYALEHAADALLEDESFAADSRKHFYFFK